MNQYNPIENKTLTGLVAIALSYTEESDRVRAMREFNKQLVAFRADVLTLGYDGKNCSELGDPGGANYAWSFPGALLFSVTAITTIGKY